MNKTIHTQIGTLEYDSSRNVIREIVQSRIIEHNLILDQMILTHISTDSLIKLYESVCAEMIRRGADALIRHRD